MDDIFSSKPNSPERYSQGHSNANEKSHGLNYDFQRLLRGIAQHELLILLLTILLAAIGAGVAYSKLTTSEASAIVLYQEDQPMNLPGGMSLTTLSLPTVLEMIQSPANYSAVEKVLGLENKSLRAMVDVPLPKGKSNFISINGKSDNEELSINVANTLAKTAVKASQDFNRRQLVQALESYKTLLLSSTNRLDSQLKELEDFKSQNRYLEMTADLTQISTLINSARARLEAATLDYRSLEIEYENLSSAIAQMPDEIPITQFGGQSPLQSRIIVLQDRISDAKVRYAPENPLLKSMESELKELQGIAKLKKENPESGPENLLDASSNGSNAQTRTNPIKERLQIQLLTLDGRMKSARQVKEDLELNYAQLDKELQNLPNKQISFTKLLNAVALTQSEVKFLTDSVETTQLMIHRPRGSIELFELADRANPKGGVIWWLLPLVTATMGALLGALIAFFIEFRDDKIRSAKQVELNYHVPCLSVIPEIDSLRENNVEKKTLFFIRNIAERLEKFNQHGPKGVGQTIGIGSSVAGEGKSMLSRMLAQYFSGLEKHVLLINADPQQETGAENDTSTLKLENYLRRPGEISKLVSTGCYDTISVGYPVSLTMKEQLKSSAMSSLWNDLKSRYDMIIIDIPGIINNDYAINLYALTDTRIFVIDSSKVGQRTVDESMEEMKAQHLPLQGVILNHVLPYFIKDQKTLNEINRLKEGFWNRLFNWKRG